MSDWFSRIVDEMPQTGKKTHAAVIVKHAKFNQPYVRQNLNHLKPLPLIKSQSAIVVSAGPSVRRKKSLEKIKKSNYQGTVICVDGSYIACLQAGIIPDFVLSLDPHPTRMVRWFGDPHFLEHIQNDDYFDRQDLNIEFRNNSLAQNEKNIALVNKLAPQTIAIVSTTTPENMRQRILEAQFPCFWWNPLVDDPSHPKSLTRKLYDINPIPCLNTGGNVGTSAWVFACEILKIPKIALVGMDFGYYEETPFEQTQTYYELLARIPRQEKISECFKYFKFPLTKEIFYIDPPYYWYRNNFLDLFPLSKSETLNCTEGGTLFHEKMLCTHLESFLKSHG
ncbi:MAG: DUF115 domain-containing protein [Deltaproteobacteria bacterium]|nr:DUF115 domain-containing protein [Deltaproteobacteria bacterium]